MADQKVIDLVQVLTAQDGQFNEEINAHVTAYPISESAIVVELEYVDSENSEEIIEVVTFTINLGEQ